MKVFGERNTGTNFLNQLIAKNTDLSVLQHEKNAVTVQRLEQLYENHHYLANASPQLRNMILARLIDQQRKEEFSQNFGWKHARVEADHLLTSPRFNTTLFIFLVRNPWRFISALHKRPYNLFPSPKGSLSDFVDSSFIANERDLFPCNFVQNPVDFWNIKVSSYFDAHKSINNSFVCYYESIMKSPEQFLHLLEPYCRVSECISVPNRSTKGDRKTFSDYQREAELYDPRAELGDSIYHKILDKIDQNVLSQTPYKSN